LAVIAYGTLRLASDTVVVYSFADSPDPDHVDGVVVAEPADPNGWKVFPLTAPAKGGQVVLTKALLAFRETGEWPQAVAHFS
jgi:hypothetical protein